MYRTKAVPRRSESRHAAGRGADGADLAPQPVEIGAEKRAVLTGLATIRVVGNAELTRYPLSPGVTLPLRPCYPDSLSIRLRSAYDAQHFLGDSFLRLCRHFSGAAKWFGLVL